VERLRHVGGGGVGGGGAVELGWRPSASDGAGLILYVVEGADTTTTTSSQSDEDSAVTRWNLLTRVRPAALRLASWRSG